MVECLNLTKPLGGARSLCTASVVNFGTSVTRTPPGMWARLRPLGAVTWFLYGGVRAFQAGESFAKLPVKVVCFFFPLCRTASSLLEETIFGCFSSHGSEGELGSGGLKEDDCLRAGACGSRASQELLFTTCAWIAPADTDGGFAGSGGRLPTAARRRHPEESGSGELPRCSRHTAHLTWGHGRRGKGRRIQAEDAYLQKR